MDDKEILSHIVARAAPVHFFYSGLGFVMSDAQETLGKGDVPTLSASSSAAGAAGPAVPGYALLREVASGGQGVVYEAAHGRTGRRVAVKVLRGEGAIGAGQRARFDREVQVLATLNHPGIVGVIDRGELADGSPFLVMEFVDGRSLDQYLEDYYRQHPDGPPPADPSELLRLFLRVCDAVNAAHLRGIVHRDLKPSNIRVDARGEPRVLDFGLAKPGLELETGQGVSLTGQFLGSLPWASPEQAGGDPTRIDVRTDVYALGVILYQMLTRRFPYEVAGTMRDVLNNIVTSRPVPPSQLLERRRARRGPLVHPAVEAIVLKALAKRPEERYQTAGEMGREIANYLAGRPTNAAVREPLRVGLATALIVLAVVLMAGITVLVLHGTGWRGTGSPVASIPQPSAVKIDREESGASDHFRTDGLNSDRRKDTSVLTVIREGVEGGKIPTEFELVGPKSAHTLPSGAIEFTGVDYPSRSYLRTRRADFFLHDFVAEVTVVIEGEHTHAFFGMGKGEPAGQWHEPDQSPTVYARLSNSGFYGGATVVHVGRAPEQMVVNTAGNGTHRVRFRWVAASKRAYFSIYRNYAGGEFKADSELPMADCSNESFTVEDAHIFIGGSGDVKFTNLEVR